MQKTSKPVGIGDKYIEFTIGLDGEVQIEPHGFKDGSCTAATKSYEDSLGVVKTRRANAQVNAQGTKITARG